MKILESKRMTMRHLEEKDAAFILSLLTDPAFIKNIGDRGVHDLEQARQYIQRTGAGYEKNGYGLYLVELKDTQDKIGICGLVRRDTLPEPDLGFAFLPAYRRQGYAVESSQTVMEFAKTKVKLKGLLAITSPGNTGSIRTLEKLGFLFQKKLRLTEADEVNLYSIRF